MSQYRVPGYRNKYYLPKQRYLTAVHYALQYPEWKKELADICDDTRKAISYDGDRVQTSNNSDPTYEIAQRRTDLEKRISMIDDLLIQVAPELSFWLRKGVCYNYTFYQLRSGENPLPCGRNMYTRIRQEFLYKLSLKI